MLITRIENWLIENYGEQEQNISTVMFNAKKKFGEKINWTMKYLILKNFNVYSKGNYYYSLYMRLKK